MEIWRSRSSRSSVFSRRYLLMFMALMLLIWICGVLSFIMGYWDPSTSTSSSPIHLSHVLCPNLQCQSDHSICHGRNLQINIGKSPNIVIQCPSSLSPSPIHGIPIEYHSSPICSSYQQQMIFVMISPTSLILEDHLIVIEKMSRLMIVYDTMGSSSLLIIGSSPYQSLYQSIFHVIDIPSICISSAIFINPIDISSIISNYQYQRSLFSSTSSSSPAVITYRQPRIGLISTDCSQFPHIQSMFHDVNLDMIPICTSHPLNVAIIHQLDVLITPRTPIDAIIVLLSPSATVIELSSSSITDPLKRFQPNLSYHQLKVHNGINSIIFSQIFQLIVPILEHINGLYPKVQLSPRPLVNEPRLAIVVPFRDSKDRTSQGLDRTANLIEFTKYMKEFLTKAGRNFDIIVIEQEPGVLFNKAALFNIGYHLIHDDYDYMALHDVDQIPIVAENDYSMPDLPLHLCSASSQYDWQPAYAQMVGGAMLLKVQHYKKMNGMSNRYWGWGMEDDDLYLRIMNIFSQSPKLDAQIGRYQALDHERVKDLDVTPLFQYNRDYLDKVQRGSVSQHMDGINTIRYNVTNTMISPIGYTKITVSLDLPWMPSTLDDIPSS